MARAMKDSGVEWIGEIPESWDVIAFWQAITRMGTGLNPRENFELSKEGMSKENTWIPIPAL